MKRVKLDDICEVLSGNAFKSKEYVEDGIRVIRITNVQKGEIVDSDPKFMPFDYEDKYDRYLLEEGDILISQTGNVGRVGRMTSELLPAFLNQRVAKISNQSPNDLLDEYLFWVLNNDSFERDAMYDSSGVAQKNLSMKWIKGYKIPLPSLEEQKAIVAKLDRAQRLIDIDKQMLAKYDQLIQSVFLEMFGDPVTNEKGWEVKKLRDLCYKITDGTHHSPETFEVEEYPYITAKHVDHFKVDFFSKPSYVKRDIHDKIYSRCNPEKGDVLLIKDGATTGKAAINPYDFEFSMLSSLALLKLNKNVLTGTYLVNVMNDGRYKDLIRDQYMSGAAIKRYTLKKINEFALPVPDLSVQEKFQIFSNRVNKEKELINSSLKKSEELFSSLVQEVFG